MPGKKKGATERTRATARLTDKQYEKELRKLQTQLVQMQEWVRASGSKVVVVFEGRDAAGKGGMIHRIMERVSPRLPSRGTTGAD
jgi:polyphosphate kinase 2 (PPK2 family)